MTPTWRETTTWPSEAARWRTKFDVSHRARVTDGVLRSAHSRCLEGSYASDVMQFGVPDLWFAVDLDAPPKQRHGDCEDYALGFMLWCVKKGIPPGSMRMLIGLKRQRRGLRVWREGHAVVLIRTTDGDWISDIDAPALFKRSRIFNTHLSAYYAFRPAAEVIEQ